MERGSLGTQIGNNYGRPIKLEILKGLLCALHKITVRIIDTYMKVSTILFHPSIQQRCTDVCDMYYARHCDTKINLQSPSPVTQCSKGDKHVNK